MFLLFNSYVFKFIFSLVDIWRKRYFRVCEMFWFNLDLFIGFRIDKFFIFLFFVDFVFGCEIMFCCFLDYDFVCFFLNFVDFNVRGLGVWKFNNFFFDDDVFCNYIFDRILDFFLCKFYFDSVKFWWGFFKCFFKNIFFVREKRKFFCRERVFLINRLIS